MKTCTKCGKERDTSQFYKDRRAKDGLQSQCKVCYATYRVEHHEEYSMWCMKNKDKLVAYHADYYSKHREEIAARKASYRTTHRDKIAAQQSIWRQTKHGKAIRRAGEHNRRANKKGNDGCHNGKDIIRQGNIQNWLCWWRAPGCSVYCRDTYHVDHIFPVAKGGHNNPSNLVISCPNCNMSKYTKLPDEFVGRLF